MQDQQAATHKVVEFLGIEAGAYRTLGQFYDFDEAHRYIKERFGIAHWDLCPDYEDCADYFTNDGRILAVETYHPKERK